MLKSIFAIAVAVACGLVHADEKWPFAILRSYGSYIDNTNFTEQVFAAQERMPGLFEEIWFCDKGGMDERPKDRGELANKMNLMIRERCRQLGIAFSYQQGITLNHNDDGKKRDFIPEDAWAVNRDGKIQYGLFCCNSPWARDYLRETAKEILKRLKPDSYWPDDDMRLLKMDWDNAYICFCDRCVKLFSDRFGRPFTRETLVAKLNGPEASATVRKAWCDFNGQSLGECAKVYREAVDAVSPETRLGVQIALSWNTVDGDSWKTMIKSLAGKNGKAGIRPGGLFYDDFDPRSLPAKMIDVARESARSGALPEIGQMCYETENWPHIGALKNAHAMMAECSWALASGCDSIAFYWGADQNGEDAASYDFWFDAVWAWRPFHLAVRNAFAGTHLGGVAAYHGSNHWSMPWWVSHEEGEVPRLMALGLPCTVVEAKPDAFWLNENCVNSLTENDCKEVFSRPVIMSAKVFSVLAKKFSQLKFTQKLGVEFLDGERSLSSAIRENGYEVFPSGLKCENVRAFLVPKTSEVKPFSVMTAKEKTYGTCVVPTEFGGKIVVAQEVPPHSPHVALAWPGCRRRAILDALDYVVPGRMPARLMTDGYSVAVSVRKHADGRTAGVFLFNLGLGETPPLELAIRRGACDSWRVMLPRQISAPAEVVRKDADEVVVKIPPMQAFSAVLVSGGAK